MPTAVGVMADSYNKPAAGGPVLTGLVGWWDASDAATFTFSSGAVVSQWRDKSGGNRHANQSATVSNPSRDSTINGHTAIKFVPSNTLTVTSFASGFTAGEVFAVYRVVTVNNGHFMSSWGTIAGVHYPYAGNVIYECWGSNTRPSLGTAVTDLTVAHIYNVRSAAGSYVATLNGVQQYSSASNTVAFSTSPHMFGQAAPYPCDGVLGEVVMYNRVLAAGERTQVETYLKGKWGTP